jgi:hypothetical protein
MPVNDQTASRPHREQPERLDAPRGASPSVPFDATPEQERVETRGLAAVDAVVQAWSAESGLSVPVFQRVYLEERVADLLDEHPAMLRHDAERDVLAAEPWLDDRAA